MSTTSETVSGRRVDLLAPDWREIDLSDIARGLSHINRFAGSTRRPISVAEHSLIVASLSGGELRLPALLHDAHEYLVGDITRPTLMALALLVPGYQFGPVPLARLTRRLDVAIARAVLEDAGIVAETGLDDESRALADLFRHLDVVDADDEAARLEDAIRRDGALTQGLSPTLSRANELYPPFRQDAWACGERWLAETRAAAKAWRP